MNIRAHAARMLAPILRREQSLQSVFDHALTKVPTSERPYFHELCFGCLRQFEFLEAVSSKLLGKKLKNKDQDIYALILLGLYQLRFMRTPDHAVMSETVSAAKALKKMWAKGFINGVLRNYLRKRDELERDLSPAATNCMPQWLLQNIQNDWPDDWQTICANSRAQAPLFVRINTRRQPLQDAAASLTQVEASPAECKYSHHALRLENTVDIAQLVGFKEGWLSVQDEAAQLAAGLLQLKPNMHVLDACAAPGGKSCHILEVEPNIKRLVALELDESRAVRIHENLTRLKLNADVLIGDGCDPESWWDNTLFDRILLDAPCSATGVIRRHPDIKLLRRESDLAKLTQIQRELLETLWQTLAPGGLLLYATCSILKAENEAVVNAFVDAHDDADLDVIDATWGTQRPAGRQLFPQAGGHDGFYYARIYKTELQN